MTTTTFAVKGMTCGHCVQALTQELTDIDGVTDVQVELVQGGASPVSVTSTFELSDASIAAAVDEAGYEVL